MLVQSLLARDSRDKARVTDLARSILNLGATLGIVIAGACFAILTFAPFLFSSNVAVAAAIRPVALPAALGLIACSFVMMLDGICIGTNDFGHLPVSNLMGLAGVAAYLAWVNAQGLGLVAIWWSMVVMFATRALGHSAHFLRAGRTSPVLQAIFPSWSAAATSPAMATAATATA